MRPGIQPLSVDSADTVTLRRITVQNLSLVWSPVAELLQSASATWETLYTLESIFLEIFLERAQLWVLEFNDEVCGCMITELVAFPKATMLRILLSAGDQNALVNGMQFLPMIETWAKKQGATIIDVYGRPGWKRVLAPHGYESQAVVVRKSIHEVWEQ